MLLAECIPCQYGQHADCVGERLPPEGMIGGSRCSCTGDCHERHPWTEADLARIEDQPDPDMAGAINAAIAAIESQPHDCGARPPMPRPWHSKTKSDDNERTS